MPKRKSAKRARQRSKAQTRHAMSAQRQATDTHYACGHVKPPKPNARVIELRTALAAGCDLATASDPVDLGLARGWISEPQHRTAMRLRALYRGTGLKGPGSGVGTLGELAEPEAAPEPDTEEGMKAWRRAITKTWDNVFSKADPRVTGMPSLDPKAYDHLATMGDEAARKSLIDWRKAMGAMTPSEQEQVWRVVIMGSWPFWITDWAAGRYDTARAKTRDDLLSGLDKAATALRRPLEAHPVPKPWTDPGPKPRAPKLVSERIRQVNADGELVREIVKLARR